MMEYYLSLLLDFILSLPLTVWIIVGGMLILTLIVRRYRKRQNQLRSTIFCPYCLNIVTKADTCGRCEEPLHKLYRESSHAGKLPELISIVGFSGHGKTVYLASLLHALTFHAPLSWQGYFRKSLDQNAIDHLRRNMEILRGGDLPDSTRLNFPKPSIQQLTNMPRFKTRVIALYDPPGEAFEAEERLEKFASFVKSSRVVLFLVSLDDLVPPYGAEIQRLLEVYTLGLAKLNASPKNQHLVVVFTKADVLMDTLFQAQPNLLSYLEDDSVDQIANLPVYLKRMATISKTLRDCLVKSLGAAGFVNFAETEFKSVDYTIISALGSPPEEIQGEDTKLALEIQPRRVLDPLIWTMEKTSAVRSK